MSSFSRLHFALAPFAAAVALFACDKNQPVDSAGEAVGTPIAGQEWVRCSFEQSAADPHALSCTSTARDPNSPSIALKVTVANLLTGYAEVQPLDSEEGETREIAKVPNSAFPLQVLVNVDIAEESAKLLGLRHGDIQLVTKINSTRDLTPEKPIVVRQPFALWPIRILNASVRPLAYSARYSTPLAPYTDFLNKSEAEIDRQVDTLPGSVSELYFAAPVGGSFFLKEAQWAIGASPKQLKISGPTDLVVTEGGLRTANPGELPDDIAPADEDAGDAGPDTALAVTCGENGLPGCGPSKNECSQGLVFGTDRLCHLCGGDGQARCQISGQLVCSAGNVYSSTDNLCHACGDDGEPRCLSGGSYVCNPGTVYTSADNMCHTCGKDGQVRCLSGGNYSCDVGHVYLSSDGFCHACGKDQQPRCQSGGGYSCDPGFVYDAASGKCKVP